MTFPIRSYWGSGIFLHEMREMYFKNSTNNPMIEKHKTKDGKLLLVSQMDDNHLKNTIGLVCRAIEKAIEGLEVDTEVSKKQAALYGINRDHIRTHCSNALPVLTQKLYPYAAEAALRGIDISERLQKAFGRTEAEGQFNVKLDMSTPFDPLLLMDEQEFDAEYPMEHH